MNSAESEPGFSKTFAMPYHLGVYLAANAVPDSCLVVDGLNCSMPKAEFIYGNHDLRSTLLSHCGEHRLVYTMAGPLKQAGNPEQRLSVMLETAARSGRFGVVMLTALPFLKLAGMDYDGLAAGVTGGAPVTEVPPLSLQGDWLDGYAQALDSLARVLPKRGRQRRRSVAVAGYLMDRNEGDHAGNLRELRRLLGFCGLELTCVFPSGVVFGELSSAFSAGLVISLPYGRSAARRLAARSGAKLLETGLPLGVNGTRAWLAAVCRAAGTSLSEEGREALHAAAGVIRPARQVLMHRPALYAGDPHLLAAFSGFACELGIRLKAAFLDSSRPSAGAHGLPGRVLFCPGVGAAAAAAASFSGYDRPVLLVGNSFAASESFAPGVPFVELGFPSYGHHCLSEEPFLGLSGAVSLAGRLLNSQLLLKRP